MSSLQSATDHSPFVSSRAIGGRASTLGEHALRLWLKRDAVIAATALVAIFGHLVLRYVFAVPRGVADVPLSMVLVLGGVPLLVALLRQTLRGQVGSHLLAGLSIITSVLLPQSLIYAI